MVKETTRSKIVAILQRRKRGTVAELAGDLGLASATVRRHLDILQRDGLITWDQVRRMTGRPHYLFSLTEAGEESLPRSYQRLTQRLLQELALLRSDEVRGLDGQKLLSLLFQRMAQRLRSDSEPRLARRDLRDRVQELVRILNEEDFVAEYEEADGRYYLVCHNCPYQKVAVAFPALCGSDLDLLGGLLRASVSREACLTAGDPQCRYLVEAS